MPKITWKQTAPMIVWNKLLNLRREKGLSQLQVAVSAGISITTLWMLENGFDRKTSIETKRKLAAFFDCDIEDIFPCERIGNKPREEYIKSKQAQQD